MPIWLDRRHRAVPEGVPLLAPLIGYVRRPLMPVRRGDPWPLFLNSYLLIAAVSADFGPVDVLPGLPAIATLAAVRTTS